MFSDEKDISSRSVWEVLVENDKIIMNNSPMILRNIAYDV